MQLHPVLSWEGHVGENIRLGRVHQRGELRDLGTELVGDATPLLLRTVCLEPSYKQHGAVDDECGVILDVEVTTGEINEGQAILDRLDAAAKTTGTAIKVVTADAGYAHAKVFGGLERREIAAVIPTKKEPIRSPVPMRLTPLRRSPSVERGARITFASERGRNATLG